MYITHFQQKFKKTKCYYIIRNHYIYHTQIYPKSNTGKYQIIPLIQSSFEDQTLLIHARMNKL